MTQDTRNTEDRKPQDRDAQDQQNAGGVHNAKPGEKVDSRSADPGQSSYGGFRGEDPSKQVQQDQQDQNAEREGEQITRTIAGDAK